MQNIDLKFLKFLFYGLPGCFRSQYYHDFDLSWVDAELPSDDSFSKWRLIPVLPNLEAEAYFEQNANSMATYGINEMGGVYLGRGNEIDIPRSAHRQKSQPGWCKAMDDNGWEHDRDREDYWTPMHPHIGHILQLGRDNSLEYLRINQPKYLKYDYYFYNVVAMLGRSPRLMPESLIDENIQEMVNEYNSRSLEVDTPTNPFEWRSFREAPCDDMEVEILWSDGGVSQDILDHDSDPIWWLERGAKSWRPIPDIKQNSHEMDEIDPDFAAHIEKSLAEDETDSMNDEEFQEFIQRELGQENWLRLKHMIEHRTIVGVAKVIESVEHLIAEARAVKKTVEQLAESYKKIKIDKDSDDEMPW